MTRVPLQIQGKPAVDSLAGVPAPIAMGFRPFFLVAAAFAVVASLMWLHALGAGTNPSGGLLPSTLWHAHEMIFGFALAVVSGFLLTAARNWTGLDTAHGYPLLGLVALWLLGRVGMAGLVPVPAAVVAVVVVGFPVALAGVVGRVIFKAGSKRNFGIVAVLAALALASLFVHLDALGVVEGSGRVAIYAALHLLILLHVVIGGRVVPLFTRNRTGVDSIRNAPTLDRVAIGAAALIVALCVPATLTQFPVWDWALGGVAAVSGVVQLARMRTWGTRAALGVPMLAVLHVGYAWIGVGHLFLAASMFAADLPLTLALHALTIGVIGTMTLGMMSRVTLGHTGRTIRAPWVLSAVFVLINLAALARLVAAVLPTEHVQASWMAAGGLFCLAYATFAVWAVRPLTTRRPDGRSG